MFRFKLRDGLGWIHNSCRQRPPIAPAFSGSSEANVEMQMLCLANYSINRRK